VTLSCPHCGGAIVVAIETQARRNTAAPPEIAHDSGSKPSTRRRPYNQGYDPLFLEFWNVYPLKRDKRKALNAWRNAVARANATVILQGARRYREDRNRLDEFTKYAEGWLNGDGWEDEPLPARTMNGQGKFQLPSVPPVERSKTAGELTEEEWEERLRAARR
jgi:hypothetical protein